MTVQQYIVDQAEQAAEELFRYATAVPSDKLEWALDGKGRTVMSICREIAQTPTWTLQAFGEAPENLDELKEAADDLRTPYECKLEFGKRLEAVKSLFLGFSDVDLAKTKWLPYNGGRDHTYLEMMDYPRWNCTYHTGQVAYIQILYGDQEMH